MQQFMNLPKTRICEIPGLQAQIDEGLQMGILFNISRADFLPQTGAGRVVSLVNMHLANASAVEICPVQTTYRFG